LHRLERASFAWRTENRLLEICLRSNLLTGSVPSLQDHPIFTFIEAEVPFVLSTDNPGVYAFSLSQEYLEFYALTGRSEILEAMFARQARYAFGYTPTAEQTVP